MLPSLLHIDDAEPAPLVGIAKLVSQGESIRQGHLVEYFTLPSRALLNRCTSDRVPFTWTINPYRGCEFACKYCYARYTHEFMEMRDGVDFERKIYVKQQAAWLLRQDLKKVKRDEEIAIGTATDPYQPAEKRFEVTLGILEELALHQGLEIGIVTKSDLILRDVDLLRQGRRAQFPVREYNHHDYEREAGAHSGAARAASRPAHESCARTECRRNQRRRHLRTRAARHHRFAFGAGCPCARDQAGRRKVYLCQSVVSEAVLGQCLPSLPREGISATG